MLIYNTVGKLKQGRRKFGHGSLIARITLLLIALLLSACNGVIPNKTYYQMPSSATAPIAKINLPLDRQIWLEPLVVADYLNGSGIVYQINDVQYVMATNNLWGSNLEQQLQYILLDNLNSQLSDRLVTIQPIGRVNKALKVTITGFHGRYDGRTIIRGEWEFNNGTGIVRKTFDIEMKQEQDGYDALVRTLAEGWNQQSLAIANQVQGILNNLTEITVFES